MHLKSFLAAAALSLGLATSASATVLLNDFELIGAPTYALGTIYSQGGIDVQYVGAASSGNVFTIYPPIGSHSWTPNGYGRGYDEITLTGGGAFTNFSFMGRAKPPTGFFQISYQTLLAGSVNGTGSFGTADDSAYQPYVLNGTFDTVRLQATGSSVFQLALSSDGEALVLDNLSITVPGGNAVPEPTTWALMLLGFGGLGGMLRFNRRKLAIV